MKYIVFDLEWNQCPYGKERECASLPFEIIEIGAVKLNSDMEEEDRFYKVVKPSVYRTLHYRTKRIVGLKAEELKKGDPFPEAVRAFFAWAGPDAIFCTWGGTDLVELQRNMDYYKILYLLKGPLHYLDVQKLYAIQHETMEKRRALEYAVEHLGLKKEAVFHNALADADYTAQILKTIEQPVILTYDSIDMYQCPQRKEDEIYAVYNGHTKYISREFESKEAAMQDPEVKSVRCCICGRKCRQKLRWFSVNARNYYCAAVCPEHGYLKGTIRMLHTPENGFFVMKKIKVTSEVEAEQLTEKKASVRRKRNRRIQGEANEAI